MHATYHEFFHIVDDHNELRQGEAAMADVWGTRDWMERHFAEGLGLWEVNVYKAAVAFQGVRYHHSEFRKRLAMAFLTLGKHSYGDPLVPEAPAQQESSCVHRFEPLSKLTGKAGIAKVCGYCGTESAYLCCTTCFPDVQECNYAICNPNTGKDCIGRHCAGEKPEHFGHKVKLPKSKERPPTRREEHSIASKKRQASEAGSLGGLSTQAAKRSRARV